MIREGMKKAISDRYMSAEKKNVVKDCSEKNIYLGRKNLLSGEAARADENDIEKIRF